MNFMKEIARILGVDFEEPFYIKDYDGVYYINEKGLCDTNGTFYSSTLSAILCGECTIIKKPWKPNRNEIYYYVDKSGVICSECWTNDIIDWNTYKLRNCYKYEEDAEKCIDKWVKFYKSDDVINVE